MKTSTLKENQLDKIQENSHLSHLAIEIAEKFRPQLERGLLTHIDLAMMCQQAIDSSTAPELLETLIEAMRSLRDLEAVVRGFLPDIDDPTIRGAAIRESCEENGPSISSIRNVQLHCRYARETIENMEVKIAEASEKEL